LAPTRIRPRDEIVERIMKPAVKRITAQTLSLRRESIKSERAI
jgi:hypothetical protein